MMVRYIRNILYVSIYYQASPLGKGMLFQLKPEAH